MADVENSDSKSLTSDNNESNEKTMTFNIARKKDKPNEGWTNPVSSARSAFDKFLSRSESTEKTSSVVAPSDGANTGRRSKKKCKFSI